MKNNSNFLQTTLVGLISGIIGAMIVISFPSFFSLNPTTPLPTQTNTVVHTEDQVINVVKKTSDSVVSIIVSRDLPIIERRFVDPFEGLGSPFGGLFGPRIQQEFQNGSELREVGGGTGFIVSEDGMIVTNKHVVSDTEAKYTVLLNDGEKVEAQVLARDPVNDIAIIQIDKTGLPTLELAPEGSDEVQIGQTVIAIGNALGEFRNTVSVGVVSGLQRSVFAGDGLGFSEELTDVIQTDAAINQGNSGGPLLNLQGQVIGINTAVARGAQNIGFSIPVKLVRRDLEQVKETGKITVAYLGVRFRLVTEEIAESENLPVDYGALIIRGDRAGDFAVDPDSAADQAGLQENDIILSIDSVQIDENNRLPDLIASHNPGDEIQIVYLSNGKEKTTTAVLAERES